MEKIYSVKDITQKIKNFLEYEIPDFYLEGEISELKKHSSGHYYFTLKDSAAIISCVMWRSSVPSLTFNPNVGTKVILYGKLGLYAPHGKYQYIARTMRPSGLGNLFLEFEKLKEKLSTEGLFSQELKQSIPEYPQAVGIITSETGAALQDMLRIFQLYAPHIQILIYPAKVQGKGAAETIIRALNRFRETKTDAVIVGRGGGSIEDLWEFNNEALARTLSDFPIPVICGVGHETDFTIADFVCDHRASTPTAAAEYVTRKWREANLLINHLEGSLSQQIDTILETQKEGLRRLFKSYGFQRTQDVLTPRQNQLQHLKQKLSEIPKRKLESGQQKLLHLRKQLANLSSETIMKKGFSYTVNKQGKIVRSASELNSGEKITTTYYHGKSISTIIKTELE